MRFEFAFPDIGEGLAEGTIVELKAQAGDHVREGDPLAVVETDKVVTDIPSPRDGILVELRAGKGDVVKVGQVFAVIELEAEADAGADTEARTEPEAEAASPSEAKDSSTVVGALESSSSLLPGSTEGIAPVERRDTLGKEGAGGNEPRQGSNNTLLASPVARKLAADTGIDLTRLHGTGPGGRVLRRDVETAADAGAGDTSGTYNTPGARGTVASQAAGADGARAGRNNGQHGRGRAEKIARGPQEPEKAGGGPRELSTIRKTIARSMEQSRSIPAASVQDWVDVDDLVKAREDLSRQGGIKAGYLEFFIKAAAFALEEYPLLNSSYDGTRMQYETHPDVNIGVAVDSEAGLVVPVIRNAGRLSMLHLREELDQLAEKARARTLEISDLRGGTFTISNFGAFAGTYGNPLILPPQVAILGTGRIRQAPVVKDGAVKAAYVLPLSLVVDHRLIDGAYASRFLALFMDLMQKPLVLLAG